MNSKKLFFEKPYFLAILVFLSGGLAFISCVPKLYKNKYITAGSFLEVISSSKDAGNIVFNEFKRLEKIVNFYDPSSELSKLNSTYNATFNASDELIELLLLSRQVYDMTGGAFDASYGNIFMFWKEFIREGKVQNFPSQGQIAKLKEFCGMQYVDIDPRQKTVTIKKASIKIDLGGIACGYMVDKAVQKLKDAGIKSALINAGGDIYCLGTNNGKPWVVGIQADSEALNEIIGTQTIIDEAITTTGNYRQYFEFNGKRYSHIVDPRTGLPVANGLIGVTVISKNCVTADSLATAFFVMGFEGIQKFISTYPTTMKIFVVKQDANGRKDIHIF